MKKLSLLFTMIWVSLTISAQKFIVDPLFKDSIKATLVKYVNDSTFEQKGNQSITIKKGETIEVKYISKRDYIINQEGKLYKVDYSNLKFSDDNPADVENPISPHFIKMHSDLSKFYLSGTFNVILFTLVALSFLLCFIGIRYKVIGDVAIPTVPVLLTIASLLEILSIQRLGDNMTWWCDSDTVGFFTALFYSIPFVIFVSLQLFSFKFYNKLLSVDKEKDALSFKPLAWTLGLLFPAIVVVSLVFEFIGLNNDLSGIIIILSVLATLIGITFYTSKRNIANLGDRKLGIIATAFTFIYLVSAIIAVFMLVMVLFKILLQIVIVVSAAVGAAFALSSDKNNPKTPRYVSKTVYEAEDGKQFDTSYACEKHNEEISKKP